MTEPEADSTLDNKDTNTDLNSMFENEPEQVISETNNNNDEEEDDEKDEQRIEALKKQQQQKAEAELKEKEKSLASLDSSAAFVPGATIWAKVKGYPWWPGRIEDEQNLPANIIDIKPQKTTQPFSPILFFGTRDYGWIFHDQLKPYDAHKNELSNKSKQASFLKAVRESLDPSCLDSTRAAATPAGPKKSTKRKNEDGEPVEEKKKKKAATAVAASNGESEAKKVKKDPAPKKPAVEIKKEEPKTPEERLKRLRSKLQNFLQNEHDTAEHHAKADKYLKEVEVFEVTVDLLLNTKIGKVMRRISEMPLENDTHNIIGRSKLVVDKWKTVVDA